MSSLTADPWNTNATQSTAPPGYSYDEAADEGEGPNSNAQPRVVSNGHERNASLASASMAQMSYSEWEKVSVTQKEEIQGKWLSHYHVYSVTRMVCPLSCLCLGSTKLMKGQVTRLSSHSTLFRLLLA